MAHNDSQTMILMLTDRRIPGLSEYCGVVVSTTRFTNYSDAYHEKWLIAVFD
jgi:hypothetical protein